MNRTNTIRPVLETLEHRAVMSANVNAFGDLVINADRYGDTASVHVYSGNWYRIVQNGVTSYKNVTGGDVIYNGSNGGDSFTNNTGLRATAYGFVGNDTLIGGWNGDYLDGGNGSDYVSGNAGNDTLFAGADSWYDYNTLIGGANTDYLYGNAGRDTLYGGYANGGNDYAYDKLSGGGGADWFKQSYYWNGWSNTYDGFADYNYWAGDRTF
jgi:Ca2+-binding RTX toxin-like protein